MAISIYTGLPGAGKSYEVVTTVILEAIRTGRRVVTNIRGVDDDEIRAYLVEQGAHREKLGAVDLISSEAVGQTGFFPRDSRDAAAVVRPGDLVVLDEVWQWWEQGKQVLPEHMKFFRMHRHITNEQGTSCDLVLITQLHGDLTKKMLGVIEARYTMHKLKLLRLKLGKWEFGKNRYRVSVFDRATARRPSRVIVREYNKRFFAFYQSYEGKGGDERTTDGRLSIFGSPLFSLVLPISLLSAGWGVYTVVGFFQGESGLGKRKKPVSVEGEAAPELRRNHLTQVVPAGATPAGAPAKPQAGNGVPFFVGGTQDVEQAKGSAWRIVGTIEGPMGIRYVLLNAQGQSRVLTGAAATVMRDGETYLLVDGQRVSWHLDGSVGSFSPSVTR